MLSVVSVHGAPTYFPSHVQYMQNNITAFGTFMVLIMFCFFVCCLWLVIKNLQTIFYNYCNRCRSKMYYKLMYENSELRKEYKRDIADLKEQVKALSSDDCEKIDELK